MTPHDLYLRQNREHASMKAVKMHGRVALAMSLVLLSSCSLIKARRGGGTSPVASAAQTVQPTAEQQEAARKMLQGTLEDQAATAALSNELGQGGDGAGETAEGERPYEVTPESPRWLEGGEYTPNSSEPEAAQQRGLRSPALPKLLPMDINGKLQGTGVE